MRPLLESAVSLLRDAFLELARQQLVDERSSIRIRRIEMDRRASRSSASEMLSACVRAAARDKQSTALRRATRSRRRERPAQGDQPPEFIRHLARVGLYFQKSTQLLNGLVVASAAKDASCAANLLHAQLMQQFGGLSCRALCCQPSFQFAHPGNPGVFESASFKAASASSNSRSSIAWVARSTSRWVTSAMRRRSRAMCCSASASKEDATSCPGASANAWRHSAMAVPQSRRSMA